MNIYKTLVMLALLLPLG